MFRDYYGKINRDELEAAYDMAREDILFWSNMNENKKKSINQNKNQIINF